MKYMQADFEKIKVKSEELTEVFQQVGMGIYQQAVAKKQRQKVETGGIEKERAGASGDGLLIPMIARLSNHVAIVLDWLAYASIGFEGDSSD
jgi:hypothetical protein